jgi:pimeloyl-ACP methyl ester carboxylesterase
VPLLSQTFRVLTYDRRGHSQSERPASQGSIREDVADLAALIEELGLAPAHIVGSSFGGSIVLRLAGERPDLFRSLIVNELPLFGLLAEDPDGQAGLQTLKAGIDSVGELLEAGDNVGGVRKFVGLFFGPGVWEQLPQEVKQIVIFNAPTFLDEMHDPEALWMDLATLRNFPQPALLTLGGQSSPYFRPVMDRIASMFPQAERLTLDGIGHEPEQDDPERFSATIIEFAERAAASQ